MERWTIEAAKPFVGPVPSAQRLFDLVDTSMNPRVKPCFYFALRNTLIADNLDVAVDWAFKHKQRFRVVTLQVGAFELEHLSLLNLFLSLPWSSIIGQSIHLFSALSLHPPVYPPFNQTEIPLSLIYSPLCSGIVHPVSMHLLNNYGPHIHPLFPVLLVGVVANRERIYPLFTTSTHRMVYFILSGPFLLKYPPFAIQSVNLSTHSTSSRRQ